MAPSTPTWSFGRTDRGPTEVGQASGARTTGRGMREPVDESLRGVPVADGGAIEGSRVRLHRGESLRGKGVLELDSTGVLSVPSKDSFSSSLPPCLSPPPPSSPFLPTSSPSSSPSLSPPFPPSLGEGPWNPRRPRPTSQTPRQESTRETCRPQTRAHQFYSSTRFVPTHLTSEIMICF